MTAAVNVVLLALVLLLFAGWVLRLVDEVKEEDRE